MFPMGSGVGAQGPDHLTFDLADASKMSLSFYGKRPGPGMRLDKQSLQFAMHDTGMVGDVLEAYERLILDAMRGDHTLFTTAEGIERLWEVSSPSSKRRRQFDFTPRARGGRNLSISWSPPTHGGCPSSERGGTQTPPAAEYILAAPVGRRQPCHNETDGHVASKPIRPVHSDVLCPRGLSPNRSPVDRFCGLWSIR
jgi:hypothetical protein